MSSPVKECLGTENDIRPVEYRFTVSPNKLTKAQKNLRRKLKKKSKANQEDTENLKSKPEVNLNTVSLSSLIDNPNTGLGKSAIVEQKMTVSSPATPGVEKSSILGIENGNGDGAVKLNKSQKKNRRKAIKKKMKAKQEDTENPTSKPEVHLNTVSLSSLQDSPNTGLGTSALVEQKMTVSSPATPGVENSSILGIKNGNGNGAVKLNKSQKKNRRKAINKKLNANREDAQTSLASNCEDHAKVADGEMGSSVMTKLNAEVKVQNIMEMAIGETGSGTNTTGDTPSKKRKRKRLRKKNPGSGETISTHESTQDTVIAKNVPSATTNVNVKGMAEEQNKKEATIGETASGTNTIDNSTSKKRKRKKLKNKNPGSGDVITTHESTQDTVIVKNDSSATTNVNMKGVAEEQNKPKSKSGSPLSGAILNTQYIHNLEPLKGEMGSGTTATDNTSAKKRKRKKSKNTNPASGDILSTRESIKVMVTEKKESSTTNVPEAVSDQMVSQGEENMNAAIGKTGSGAETEAKENQACIRNLSWQRKKNQNMGIKEVFQAPELGKKLLIFDVNGLLADIVSPRPKDVVADLYIRRKAIFKRPFLEDFMHFCFERFNVAIWSSRTKDNVDLAVDFLLGDLKKKLIFVWGATKCTSTGIRTLEDKYKCIVLKDLRKIWENGDADGRWVKGTFNESNTLLLDDSPYKALLNPTHSGIYPTSYCYKNRDDNFLGPESELRTYLEGLAVCDNVKTYVEQNPFGQGAIDEKSPHWSFYKRVVKG